MNDSLSAEEKALLWMKEKHAWLKKELDGKGYTVKGDSLTRGQCFMMLEEIDEILKLKEQESEPVEHLVDSIVDDLSTPDSKRVLSTEQPEQGPGYAR